jgi:hypothetical protein
MIGQILPNNNESATRILPQKVWDLNMPLINILSLAEQHIFHRTGYLFVTTTNLEFEARSTSRAK